MKKVILTALAAVMLLCSCSANKYAATAGGVKITAGEISFYLTSIKNQMSGTELSDDEDWQTQEIEGAKAIDFAKQKALDAAIENISYVEIAKNLKISLTDEEKQRIKLMKNNLVSQYGTGSGYKTFLKQQKISDNFIDMLCESMVYSEKLSQLALSENPITDEKKKQKFEEMLSGGCYKAKHILFLTVDEQTRQPLDEEKIKEAEQNANAVYKRALAGEDFDALMNEYSQDPGLSSNPDGYVFSSGEMVPAFESCTASLTIDAIGFCRSDFGYHIIKRLPLVYSEVESKIESELTAETLKSAMEKWKEDAGFSVVKNDEVFDSIM